METRGSLETLYGDFLLRCDSACFRAWSEGVLGDPEVQGWLATLPDGKAQPNLVFAAARWHGVPAPGPYAALREALLADDAAGGPGGGPIRATILARRTQTNEVGRLATLVPALAGLARQEGDRPLALVEVGASAGLCLYPDRWAYAWETDDGPVTAGDGAGPLRCRVHGPAPLPAAPPAVAWRGGLDLHPLDVMDPDHVAWLTTLVWPEHDDRRSLLAQGVEVARAEPPDLRRGDLLEALPALVEEASAHGPVVVMHSAVVAYLTEEDRARFDATMRDLVAAGACHWVSNEGPQVLPSITATAPPAPDELTAFVLGVDGRAVAWTHGHGRWMTWG